jgi:hypothetical protein
VQEELEDVDEVLLGEAEVLHEVAEASTAIEVAEAEVDLAEADQIEEPLVGAVVVLVAVVLEHEDNFSISNLEYQESLPCLQRPACTAWIWNSFLVRHVQERTWTTKRHCLSVK